MEVILIDIDVMNLFDESVWAVRARLNVSGRAWVCLWKFKTENAARYFADDREAVFVASQMVFESGDWDG